MRIEIIYNKDYSGEDFPSKFVGDKEVKIIRIKGHDNLKKMKENLDDYISANIKPLDIVKILRKLPKGQRKRREKAREDYWGHAFIYLGWDPICKEHKVCHAYSNQDGHNVIKISGWENNFWDRLLEEQNSKDKMIIIHNPKGAFKEPNDVVKHIAKCIEGKNRYFEKFGEIKIETNNCEHFTNRCVLGLNFSELVDAKNGVPNPRIFNDFNAEINTNNCELDSLTTSEQQVMIKIGKYKNQAEVKFEAKVIEKIRINGLHKE